MSQKEKGRILPDAPPITAIPEPDYSILARLKVWIVRLSLAGVLPEHLAFLLINVGGMRHV
jgi:hypothetical protein